MKSGIVIINGNAPIFDSFKFHNQIKNKEIEVTDTQHKFIAKVTHKCGYVEYIFWDEADMACPGGETYEQALNQLNSYIHYLEGVPE